MDLKILVSILIEDYKRKNNNEELPEIFYSFGDIEKLNLLKKANEYNIGIDLLLNDKEMVKMSKLVIPSNISLSSNAKKHLKILESNGNYNPIIPMIQEMLNHISKNPYDDSIPHNKGWKPEKLKNKKNYYSFRITQGDRLTYKIEDGQVTILGFLKHYDGTKLSYTDFEDESYEEPDKELRVEMMYGGLVLFFRGEISYSELLDVVNDFEFEPKLVGVDQVDSVEEFTEIRKRFTMNALWPSDIKGFTYVYKGKKIDVDEDNLLLIINSYNFENVLSSGKKRK